MKKIVTFFTAFMMAGMAFSKPVTLESARRVADNYYSHNSTLKSGNLNVRDVYRNFFKGMTTFYVFNYQAGGFVVVAADDAVSPILAESDTGYFDSNMSNPGVKYWFDGYNRQIEEIVTARYANTETLPEWNKIQTNTLKRSTGDVSPLLKTNWDQGCNYNAKCPTDATAAFGACGHAWTGCVATTMSQLVKYHKFPAHGYLSHSYQHPTYGVQTADFASTTYDWAAMPATVTSSNANVAAVMFQTGVSVDMDYGAKASGAFSEDVAWALVKYFNYDPSTIAFKERNNFTSSQWIHLLKAELDASRPIYYSGNDDSTGHAWVCDGYRNADDFFHMNWGWSGAYNGYYKIGALNPHNYMPNQNNGIITGIKPGNPNLVARIINISNNTTLFADAPVPIDVRVVEGVATTIKLFVDKTEIYSSAQPTFTFNWSTTGTATGMHILKVVAMNATDTVSFPINISVNGWIKQSTGFTAASRGIQYIHAVDSLVVWATAYDGSGVGATINEFTRTINGGNTWTPGQILGGTVYGIGNICGLNKNIAFVSVYNGGANQDLNCGVYKTKDGGATWTHLTGALQGPASFANNVWFWNENEGMCHGDVKDNYFEIYTTSNAGLTWTRVPKTNIGGGATAASGEGGWTSVIQAIGDSTIMFGSNKSNLYISHNRGHNWIISNTGIIPGSNGGIKKIAFKDKMKGLVAQTGVTNAPAVLRETHDGGITWQSFTTTGFLTSDLTYVEGTDNTFVCTGITGASYSFDGGHTWQSFKGTELTPYISTDWVNNRNGWAGGFSTSATDGGIYKFKGILNTTAPLPVPENLRIALTGNDVMVSWNVPVTTGIVTGYNVFRNGILLTPYPIAVLFYQDLSVGMGTGNYDYCVAAVYDMGVSAQVCTKAALAIEEYDKSGQKVKVYPNPSMGHISIDSELPFISVRILNTVGQVVYSNDSGGHHLEIITSSYKPGLYLVRVQTKEGSATRKISFK